VLYNNAGAVRFAGIVAADAVVIACDIVWPAASDPTGTGSAGGDGRLRRRELDVISPKSWSALAAELAGGRYTAW
jgi:hypothetical protein